MSQPEKTLNVEAQAITDRGLNEDARSISSSMIADAHFCSADGSVCRGREVARDGNEVLRKLSVITESESRGPVIGNSTANDSINNAQDTQSSRYGPTIVPSSEGNIAPSPRRRREPIRLPGRQMSAKPKILHVEEEGGRVACPPNKLRTIQARKY